jgi:hypothetical protein
MYGNAQEEEKKKRERKANNFGAMHTQKMKIYPKEAI